MQDLAFSAPGRFWRGNLHTHSDRSDGVLCPQDVCERYRAQGYDFVAVTDHFIGRYGYPIVDTRPFRTQNFTTLLGAEVHSGTMENGELWHLLAVGLPLDFAHGNAPDFAPAAGMEPAPALAQRCRDAGAFVVLAHPEWSGLSMSDALSITAAHAVEIYNHNSLVGSERGGGAWHLDRLLEAGRKVTLCATDDAHFDTADYFGGWSMVKAVENTPEALLAALKAGHMYASMGPLIDDVIWDDQSVTVRCSPAVSIVVQGQGSSSAAQHGTAMTEVKLPLGRVGQSPWMRLTVVDAQGKRAWTNPIWR